jgi:hypothetical protein
MNIHVTADLPERFCWTRFGTEAGQTVEAILDRKEKERSANGGTFLWGIGNSVGSAIKELLRWCNQPQVVFSPILGAARPMDIRPDTVVAWTSGETVDGEPYELPPHSLVLSGRSGRPNVRPHYALVCYSGSPLAFESSGASLLFDSLRNLISGNPVGWSQVTAVVSRDFNVAGDGKDYPVAFRALLAEPYFIRLRNPVVHEQSGSRTARTLCLPTEPVAGVEHRLELQSSSATSFPG